MLGSTCPRCYGDGALSLAVVVLVLFSFPLTAPLFHLTLLAGTGVLVLSEGAVAHAVAFLQKQEGKLYQLNVWKNFSVKGFVIGAY